MLRSTTKAIETKFGSWLIRCHRGYLVNKNKIRIFRNDRDGMYISLMHDGIRNIPVSKSYAQNIQRMLSQSAEGTDEYSLFTNDMFSVTCSIHPIYLGRME
jgi:DNA-binding LytR/AlgR family response regulator